MWPDGVDAAQAGDVVCGAGGERSFLPLVEAHLEFQGGARYDDLLEVASAVDWSGRARLRFDVQVSQAETGRPVVRGYTVHAFTDRQGKPIRPPAWFVGMLATAQSA